MAAVWTVSSLLATAAGYLAQHGSPSARLDAELLLARVLGVERMTLYLDGNRPLAAPEIGAFRHLIRRRARHEPVAYILGRAHFRYLELEVTPAVLVPRPETEELVDRAFAWLDTHPLALAEPHPLSPAEAPAGSAGRDADALGSSSLEAPPRIADVGTGSGAIALSLASERGLRVLAVDSSGGALAVAAGNRERLGLGERIELREGDLLWGIADGSLRLVLSNPPYVSDQEMQELPPDVAGYEPQTALRGGPDGLDVIRRLLPDALRALSPGGRLLLEVGVEQAAAVVALGREAGFCCADVYRDLSGKERIVGLSCPGAPLLEMAEALAGARREALRRALRAGAVVGVPTDTVYGLAAAWDSGRGVRRLFEAKGREQAKPVATLFGSVETVCRSLPDLPPAVAGVLREFLPGPFTFVVPTMVPRPDLVGTEDSLGVRVPDHPGLLAFLVELDVPLAATSANRSGEPEAAAPADVDPELAAACAALLAAGPAARPGGVASTVVDVRTLDRDGRWAVLREGVISTADLTERMSRLAF